MRNNLKIILVDFSSKNFGFKLVMVFYRTTAQIC